jgi:hypothetical protein
MEAMIATRSLQERALDTLRRSGNPFRNYFARNPDDEVCGRYHVPELYAVERAQLLAVTDLYRYDPNVHSDVVPVLGNKGAGKTHLLHSIKHGGEGAWQLLVTPGTYHKDTDFLEYLLFQIIDTLLSGGTQKGNRPLQFVGEELSRRLLRSALENLSAAERLDLFPLARLGRWARRLGIGSSQAHERTQWLLDSLTHDSPSGRGPSMTIKALCAQAGVDPDCASRVIGAHVDKSEAQNTAGLMRRHIHQGFVRSALVGNESDLANFLTYGFAELEFQVRPTRQDLVLALLKALCELFTELKIPIVVAFDQLEDLLLARRTDDGRRIAESFFAGIVQAMHQIKGICFLIFAERGLWNRFVPSLDGYIQDRLNNPIHVPGHGTIKTLRLEAPSPALVRRVVEARLRPALEELPDFGDLSSIFPFQEDQIERIARAEPTLRDMLQQFRLLFEHIVFGDPGQSASKEQTPKRKGQNRLSLSDTPIAIKSLIVVETPAETDGHSAGGETASSADASDLPQHGKLDDQASAPPLPTFISEPRTALEELWNQQMTTAAKELQPEGALTGATRELQAGLGKFLQTCHEHGVKVGPWRLQHVVPEMTFGDHPTYGAISIAHWVCKDGQPWKVGIGLFLGRGPGKPKDLQIKLAALEVEPALIDYMILLRPGDDLTLTGKSKSLWQEAEERGRHARLESMTPDSMAILYGFARWMAAVTDSQTPQQPTTNFADFLQEHARKLLGQLCLPVQE